MARPFAAPPGIPADRKAALIAAFDATMKDPEYLADAKKLNIDVNPVSAQGARRAAGRALRDAEGRGEEGERGDHEVDGSPQPCRHPSTSRPGLIPAIHVFSVVTVATPWIARDKPAHRRGMTIDVLGTCPPSSARASPAWRTSRCCAGAGGSSTTSRCRACWHAAFVRSPHPHALIKGIDKAAALALPGVHAVLTLDDLATVMVQRRMVRHSNSGMPLDKAWPFALADGEVSLRRRAGGDGGRGQPLCRGGRRRAGRGRLRAAAVRRRRAAGGDGAAGPPRAELATSSPPTRSRSATPTRRSSKAAHVFKQELWQHRGAAHSIEARGTLAEVRGADGGITVHASTQKAHDLRRR